MPIARLSSAHNAGEDSKYCETVRARILNSAGDAGEDAQWCGQCGLVGYRTASNRILLHFCNACTGSAPQGPTCVEIHTSFIGSHL
jgi:hypothetical protein